MFIDDDEGTDDALLTHQTLVDTQEKLGALLDLMPTGLIIHQMQGMLYANQRALSLIGQTSDSIIGKHILDFLQDKVRDEFLISFMEAFSQKKPIALPEFTLCDGDGKTHFIKATAGLLPWEGTPVVQVLLEDVTELKLQAEELRKLTLHDALTGSFNRRYFIEQAENQVAFALKNKMDFSLLIFDVDHFKQVNDTYGHLAGDEALRRIVKVWNDNTRHSPDHSRPNDGTLARIGGEEFAIFMLDADRETALRVAERIRLAFSRETIDFQDVSFKITASFGVTSLLAMDSRLDDLIRRADIALYRAKANGRNCVEVE